MKGVSRPILGALRKRYASQASASSKVESNQQKKQEPVISKLPNGVVLASYENNSPVTNLAVIYNAGSRYEKTPEEKGITHCLRLAANLSNKKSSAFGTLRHLQQLGSTLEVTSTKEHMIYTLDVLRDAADIGMEYLANVSHQPAFSAFELSDALPQLKFDIANASQNTQFSVMEALHKAAFRDGLGNHLFMPEYQIGKHDPELLEAFVGKYYVPSNMAIVSIGMDHESLIHHVHNKFGFPKRGDAIQVISKDKAKYSGGELRMESGSDMAHIAIACEGVSIDSADVLPLAILRKALGGTPSVKYGSSSASRINKAVAKVSSSPFHAQSISINYSDSGLFGFYAVTASQEAEKLVRTLAQELRSAANITKEDFQRAKNQAMASVLMEGEIDDSVIEDMAHQALLTHDFVDPTQVACAVEGISYEQVVEAARKIGSKKISMASSGCLDNVPYVDQL